MDWLSVSALALAFTLVINIVVVSRAFTTLENDVKWIKKELKDINTIFKMLARLDKRVTSLEAKEGNK